MGQKTFPLAQDDIPQVADLYWTVLRERNGPTPASVQSFLRELYFANHWMDRTLPLPGGPFGTLFTSLIVMVVFCLPAPSASLIWPSIQRRRRRAPGA